MAMRYCVVLLLAGLAAGQVSKTPPKPEGEFKPGPPVEQPVPFSHRVHVATGLRCAECHPMAKPGDFAGLPTVGKCMQCHSVVKRESEAIQRLAATAAAKREVAWVRVYRAKEFVYFSHRVHATKAGIGCGTCHGEVEQRDVLFQERSLGMYACMGCHEKRKAPNGCELCHDTH